VKGYSCSLGPNVADAKLSVEFYSFSPLASAMLAGGGERSKLLTKMIGAAKIVDNDVLKAYADLTDRFGEWRSLQGYTWLGVRIAEAGQSPPAWGRVSARDDSRSLQVKALLLDAGGRVLYPNLPDIELLLKRQIPTGMKFYYTRKCDDVSCPEDSKFQMHFWRPVRSIDVADYRKNLIAFNRSLKFSRDLSMHSEFIDDTERYLKLIKYMAGDLWPDDVLTMKGIFAEDDNCDAPLKGWNFDFEILPIKLDAVLVRNTSSGAVGIDGIFGKASDHSGLRAAQYNRELTGVRNPLPSVKEQLEPGESLLIPTRIFLPRKESSTPKLDEYAHGIFSKVGANGFKGTAADFDVYRQSSYAYGPEIEIGAIGVAGRRLDLKEQPVNFADMTYGIVARSCPYLLVWDEKVGGWVSYGKILDSAPGRDREYTETRTFAGFPGRIRIEEREPEVAIIDQVELIVSLKGGANITLKSPIPALSERDNQSIRLYWGEDVELEFNLPGGVAKDDVVSTQVAVTGYYMRYAVLSSEEDVDRPND
jgi:hypothetical protein